MAEEAGFPPSAGPLPGLPQGDGSLTLDQYIAKLGTVQAGPCAGCGATNYGLSMGGPGICPACDCLPPERRVMQLAEENRKLRERNGPPNGDDQCPATTRHVPSYLIEAFGIQCKYQRGHQGDHAGYGGFGQGDVFWPQDSMSAEPDWRRA